jgi:hypothetical protein
MKQTTLKMMVPEKPGGKCTIRQENNIIYSGTFQECITYINKAEPVRLCTKRQQQ